MILLTNIAPLEILHTNIAPLGITNIKITSFERSGTAIAYPAVSETRSESPQPIILKSYGLIKRYHTTTVIFVNKGSDCI